MGRILAKRSLEKLPPWSRFRVTQSPSCLRGESSGQRTSADSEFVEICHGYRCTSRKALGFAPSCGLTWRSGNLYLPIPKGVTNPGSDFLEGLATSTDARLARRLVTVDSPGAAQWQPPSAGLKR